MTYNFTVDSNTIREDLSDLIDIMTPADAPIHALCDEEPVYDTYHDWSMDELAIPTSPASVIEGATPSYLKVTEPVRPTAPVCIVTEPVEVADTRRVVRTAGMDDAYNYFIWKAAIKVMKQMEVNMHFGDTTIAVITNEDARMCEGLLPWAIDSAKGNTIAGMDFSSGAAFAPYSPSILQGTAAGNALTRLQLHDNILQPFWDQGGNVMGSVFLCGGKVKRIISEFAMVYAPTAGASNRRNINQNEKKMVETIDFFDSDFGTIAMNLDRYMHSTFETTYATGSTIQPRQMGILFEPEKVTRLTLRGLGHVPTAKVSDGSRGFCVYEAGLKISNTLALLPAVGIATPN